MKYSFIHVCSTVLINQQKSRVEKHYKVRVMPGFHHSVTVLPLSILQFVHTVQPMSMVQPILPYIFALLPKLEKCSYIWMNALLHYFISQWYARMLKQNLHIQHAGVPLTYKVM